MPKKTASTAAAAEKSKIQRAVDHIAAHPGCRTDDLAQAMGSAPQNVAPTIFEAVQAGLILTCKVASPSGKEINEYRLSSSAPANPDWREWKAAHPARADRPLKTAAVAGPRASAIATTQAHRGANNGSSNGPVTSFGISPAGAVADVEPPKPAPTQAEAGSVETRRETANSRLDIQLDNHGCLLISTDETVIELSPAHVRELAQFLIDTEPAWA